MRSFNKNKELIQKFKETGDLKFNYQNELDNACFQLDMAYGDFRDIPRRTITDEILHNKTFNIKKKIEI